MPREHSPLPYELPQPHASSSRHANNSPASSRGVFRAVDQNRLAKAPSSTTKASCSENKRSRQPTPMSANDNWDQPPTVVLASDDAEGEEEGVLFSEEQMAEDDIAVPATTEPLESDRGDDDATLGAEPCQTEKQRSRSSSGTGLTNNQDHEHQAETVPVTPVEKEVRPDNEDVNMEAEEGEQEGDAGDFDMEESHEAQDEEQLPPHLRVVHSDRFFNITAEDGQRAWDGFCEDEASSTYHSGDSDLYDMPHRPILERTAVKRDIRQFRQEYQALGVGGQYVPIDRLGEGTFSSVYLAKDVDHHLMDNRYWGHELAEREIALGQRNPRLSRKTRGGKVALKKILATSSTTRIQNELELLESLRGSKFVTQLITAFRDDEVGGAILVLPYFEGDDFRYFYKHMDLEHIRSYMFTLLYGLHEIHRRGVIHRDIKPANFLYNYEQQTGAICDLGLAERYVPPRKVGCQHGPATLEHLHGVRQQTSDTKIVEQAHYDANKRGRAGDGRIGIPKDDKRPAIKANRSGTRGFRAPEVLLKCPDHTPAIDVWSAGVILLGILTRTFPAFNASDDTEALMELASLFGKQAIERVALLHIISNVPSLEGNRPSLKNVILRLNPDIYTPMQTHPTAEEARIHIEGMDDAINLCVNLLTLDATKRPTARRILQHKLFEEGLTPSLAALRRDPDLQGKVRVVHPWLGKCGLLHNFPETGHKHVAIAVDGAEDPMGFGQGYPLKPGQLCPEHEHMQERIGQNIVRTSAPYRSFPDPLGEVGQPDDAEWDDWPDYDEAVAALQS